MRIQLCIASFTFLLPFFALSQHVEKSITERDNEVLWQEDFSNGFEGLDGSWSFGLVHGELWFITTPDQYDPTSALENASELYGTKIPLLFENTTLINSPTRANG